MGSFGWHDHLIVHREGSQGELKQQLEAEARKEWCLIAYGLKISLNQIYLSFWVWFCFHLFTLYVIIVWLVG